MTSLTGDNGAEAASDVLHVQLDNARNFTNTLQQIAWALSLRIKGLSSNDSNTSKVSNINEETKCGSLTKTKFDDAIAENYFNYGTNADENGTRTGSV